MKVKEEKSTCPFEVIVLSTSIVFVNSVPVPVIVVPSPEIVPLPY